MRTGIRIFSLVLTLLCLMVSSRCPAQFNSDFYAGSVRPAMNIQQQASRNAFSSRPGTTVNQSIPTANNYNATFNGGSVTLPGANGNFSGGSIAPGVVNDSIASNSIVGEKVEEDMTVEAVLVAINNYNTAGLSNLKGCNNDIRIMKEWLKAVDTPSESITVLSDDKELGSALPERNTIETELRRKAEISCSRLIVVFACHGISAGGKSFICPMDTKSTEFDGLTSEDTETVLQRGTENNLLAVSSILSILKNSRAKEVLLILDACRNRSSSEEEGGFMREFMALLNNNDESFQKSNGGSFVVLTSCSSGQSAIEINDTHNGSDHGAFLYHFVNGLSGWADFAACYDGTVSLVEAYNYAYSRVASDAKRLGNREQTPEIFMSSSSGNMKLATYSYPPATENETEIQFLMRAGIILADNKWKKNNNAVGVQALDCVLKNVPNNTLAYALRGSALRKLGEYEKALADLQQIGDKFQLYVKLDEGVSLPLLKPLNDKGVNEESSVKVKNNSLITVSHIQDDYFLVREVDNEAIGDEYGWIHRDYVTWNRNKANDTITATRMQRATRTVTRPAAIQPAPVSRTIEPGTSGFRSGNMISPQNRGNFGGGQTISGSPAGPFHN